MRKDKIKVYLFNVLTFFIYGMFVSFCAGMIENIYPDKYKMIWSVQGITIAFIIDFIFNREKKDE